MLRYSLFLLLVTGSVATAIASVGPAPMELAPETRNVTVIEKNQAYPILEPAEFHDCAMEDCSDVWT
jgi:hypothetical protein